MVATPFPIRRTLRIPDQLFVAAFLLSSVTVSNARAQEHDFVSRGYAGLGAAGTAVGDVDGDGRLDLVSVTTAGGFDQFVSYLGDGLGFGPGLTSPYGLITTDGLAAGDLDGDGLLDVVANAWDPPSGLPFPRLIVGRGTGDGGFAVNAPSGMAAARESELADLDNDGDLDLVTITIDSIISYRNSGTASFSPSSSVLDPALSGGSSTMPQRLAVGDLDGDGDPDVAGMGSFGPIVLVRNALVGSTSTLSSWQSIPAGSSALDFAIVDLHGDGDLDLAVTGSNPQNQLRVITALGGGAFSTGTLVPGATGSSFVVGADFDFDGRDDLVVERQAFASAAVGLPIPYAAHALPPTERARVADFNGDARPDLLLVGTPGATFPLTVGEIVLNDGSGRFPSQIGSTSWTIRAGLALDDYDGDADLDVLALAFDPSFDKFVGRIQTGNGAGSFTDGAASILDVTAQFGSLAVPAAAVDLNGDGLRDLLVADSNSAVPNPRLQALLANPSGGFSANVSTFVSVATTALHFGRVNADPFVDAIMERVVGSSCEYRVAFGNGAGGFTLAPSVKVSPGPVAPALPEPTAVADVTGDGLDDLIVRIAALGPIRVWRGLGNGDFVFHGDTPWANDGVFTVAELTGDGAADLVLLEIVDARFRLEIRPGSGGGVFFPGVVVSAPAFADLLGVEVIDIDGDGDRDVVGYGAQSGTFVLFPDLGGGNFAAASSNRVGIPIADFPIRQGPLFGDVDSDGRSDAVAVARTIQFHEEIVVVPGGCGGRTVGYGHGCPGAGGFVPKIAIVGAPCPGHVVTFEIRDGLGGSFALVFLGSGEGAVPVTGGCDLLLAPLLPDSFTLPLSGSGPGQGKAAAIAFLPPSIDGATLTLQAFVADPTFAGGVAASAGLAAWFVD